MALRKVSFQSRHIWLYSDMPNCFSVGFPCSHFIYHLYAFCFHFIHLVAVAIFVNFSSEQRRSTSERFIYLNSLSLVGFSLFFVFSLQSFLFISHLCYLFTSPH